MTHTSLCPPQEHLRNGGTLSELQTLWGIESRRHGTYPNLVQLKYNQISSPMHEAVVQESRGLILDQDDDWRIIAWPFRKFFNAGEPHAATIDWTTARVQEKLDGSLMILYWYDGAWQVATSGMPDAAGPVHGTQTPFKQLFWDTWFAAKWPLPVLPSKGHTLLFELMSPYNRVVVEHSTPTLSLVGMRSIYTGNELPAATRTAYNPVREFPLRNLDDVMATFEAMSPLTQEGYVIVDAAFNRIKVKHPGYVALHHLRSSFSTRRLVEVIRSGDVEELKAYFPEWHDTIDGVKAAYDALVVQLEGDYETLRGIEDRKDFALAAKLSPYPATHFMLRDGHATSVKDALKSIHIDRMMGLLGVRHLNISAPI